MEEKFNEEFLDILLKLEELQKKYEKINKLTEKLKLKYLENKDDENINKKIQETELYYKKLLDEFKKLNVIALNFNKNKTQGN